MSSSNAATVLDGVLEEVLLLKHLQKECEDGAMQPSPEACNEKQGESCRACKTR